MNDLPVAVLDQIVRQQAEIDRLKAELETTQLHLMEEETTRKIWEQDCKKAESQLVEARAEVERLSLENRQMLQDMKWDNQLKSEARQKAAREILQLLDTADWACSTYEETYYQAVAAIKSKFKLEG